MSSAPRNRKKPAPVIAIEPLKLNIGGVCALTGLSEAVVRRAVKAGAFPAPVTSSDAFSGTSPM